MKMKSKKFVSRIVLMGMMVLGIFTGISTSVMAAPKEITVGVTSFADTLETTEQYFSWVVSRYGVGETLVKFDEHGEKAP